MIKKVVYTCITGNYDSIPVSKPVGDFDFICFVDDETFSKNKLLIESLTEVKFRLVPAVGSPQEVNRILKIRPHEFLVEYEESFYIDGNLRLKSDPFSLEKEIPGNKSVALYLQPHRNCAYKEIDELVRVGIAKGSDAEKLKLNMKMLGLPYENGLFEANIIYRRHHDSACIRLMKIWWDLWERSLIKRDQPYLALANFFTNMELIHPLGYSNLNLDENNFFFYEGRIVRKNKFKRLFRRIISEIFLYKGYN